MSITSPRLPIWETLPYPLGVATNSRVVGAWTRTIAAELRNQRVSRRLKQEEVSAATGIPVNTLSKMERGQTAIDMEQIEAIAERAFNMLPEDLMALARKHEAERVAAEKKMAAEETYLPDGRLNPANIRGGKPSKQDLDELIKRRSSEG